MYKHKDQCNKPRFNNKVIYPATAISSLVYGGNKIMQKRNRIR